MPGKKYTCDQCGELFELLESQDIENLRCPRCASMNIEETNACRIGVGPPPWEYKCRHCNIRFRIEAPSGPDEANIIRCPVCGSHNINWLAYISEACPTGG